MTTSQPRPDCPTRPQPTPRTRPRTRPRTVRSDPSTVRPRARPPLWDRRFTLFFAARTVSMFGDAMMPVAAALAVGALYGISGVGYVLGTWTGTFVLLVLFGGVFADRFGARRLMVVADLVRVLSQGVLAVAFFAGPPPFWLLVTMASLAGAAVAMFLPGANGMVPLVAREPQRANATLKVADALAHLLGPAFAGLLIALTSAGTVYAIDAATFALSALCLALIRLAPNGSPADTAGGTDGSARTGGSLRRDLRQGWQEFRARTWMWAVILIWVGYGVLVFGPLVPLSSALVGARLGPNAYGLAVSFLGAGAVLGGLLALRVRPVRPLAAGAVAMGLYTVLPLCVALGAGLPVLLAGHVLGGGAMAFWSVMWATSVQTHTPPAVLNRVSAYELAGSVSGIALGQILAGPALALASPGRLLLVSAGACLAGCAALFAIPAIRSLRRAASADGGKPGVV
ncbi:MULTISPECIES: MFS transporter [unclassified Streptomyces]|uniref:MFS transporter n=1 Tax=unclassified Streptomyces TaxID=2593676 RepID=UPI000823E353|nr:MFS transporter [Streptomyces sp. AmelKG-E11A]SCK35223.1 Predicted arabinose efflux permease, MFS family [Streptomyces sp. AmelKG-E11A]